MRPQSLKNLLKGLVRDGRIQTTLARAKTAQRSAEHLLTVAKKATLPSRRQIQASLGDKKLANKLVDQIAAGFGQRQSGFTRIIKMGPRRGDGAMVAKIEFVEFTQVPVTAVAKPAKEPVKTTKKTASGRMSKKK